MKFASRAGFTRAGLLFSMLTISAVTVSSRAADMNGVSADLPQPAPTGPGSTLYNQEAEGRSATYRDAIQQSQAYERANETNAIQILYVTENLQTVSGYASQFKNGDDPDPEMKDDGTKDQDFKEAKKKLASETSGYCDSTISSAGNALSCIQEYRAMRTAQLEELKENLVQNQDSIGRLRAELKTADTNGSAKKAPVFAGTKAGVKLFPKIPSFVDLSNDYADRMAKMASYKTPIDPTASDEEINKFLDRVFKEPEKDATQFPKTREVYLNPADPKGGTFKVNILDAKGNPTLDREAYDKAMKHYEKTKSLIVQHAGSGGDAKEKAAVRKIMFEHLKKLRAQRIDDFKNAKDKKEALRGTFGDQGDSPFNARKPAECEDLKDTSGPRYEYCYVRSYVTTYYNNEEAEKQAKAASEPPKGKGGSIGDKANIIAKQRSDQESALDGKKYNEGYEIRRSTASVGTDPAHKSTDEERSLYLSPSSVDEIIGKQLGE